MPERMRRFIIGPFACGLESHRTYQPPNLPAVKKSMICADLLKCVIFKQHPVNSSAPGQEVLKGAKTPPGPQAEFSLKLYPLSAGAGGCRAPGGRYYRGSH